MKALIVAIILIILLIFLNWRTEHMTKIRRGVGFGNSADEIPVAAGVVHSAPIMDMTHTYWDGHSLASCDECPSIEICKGCPNITSNIHKLVDNDTSYNPATFTSENFTTLYDMEEEFAQSRERLGASRGGRMSGSIPMGQIEPAICDHVGLRTTGGKYQPAVGYQKLHWYNDYTDSATDLIKSTLGIEDAGPAPDDLELLGASGYIYKEK